MISKSIGPDQIASARQPSSLVTAWWLPGGLTSRRAGRVASIGVTLGTLQDQNMS